jgi:hypothetical protein
VYVTKQNSVQQYVAKYELFPSAFASLTEPLERFDVVITATQNAYSYYAIVLSFSCRQDRIPLT